MLTGDAIDAEEAHRLGMVSKIFPSDELADRTLEFARRIAALPTMTALLIKESVNQTRRQHGLPERAAGVLHLHQLNHAHWAEVHEDQQPAGCAEDGIPTGRTRRRSCSPRKTKSAPARSGLPPRVASAHGDQ